MQTEFIINLNALPALLWMLDNQKKNIRKEACWTISNITAGHPTLPYPTYSLTRKDSNRLFLTCRDIWTDPGCDQCGSVPEADRPVAVLRVRYPEGGGLGRVQRHLRRSVTALFTALYKGENNWSLLGAVQAPRSRSCTWCSRGPSRRCAACCRCTTPR